MSFSTFPHQPSPSIHIHGIAEPGYFDITNPYNTPHQRSISRGSSRSSLKRQWRFEEDVGAGLGIRMVPIAATPASPGHVYQLRGPHTPYEREFTSLPSDKSDDYGLTPYTPASFSTTFSRSRTDPMTQRLIQHRATQAAKWRIHWRTPTLMVVSFLVGIVLAIGQHLLYQSLHRTTEDDEGMKVRVVLYGRALAYLSKVAFGGSVIVAFRQRIWRTFRNRALSVLSIDQLFLATEDPSLFLNWETITKASLVTLMALCIWLIPIATVVFSPAALTFGNIVETESSKVPVPTLNFTAESYKNFRIPVEVNGTKKKSLIFSNTTDLAGTSAAFFDYYDQPSADLKRISLMTGYSLKDQPLRREDARIISCGGDYNCTYTISFVAPSYKCEELARGPGDDLRLGDAGAPFTTSTLSPRGPHVYFANVSIGDYVRPQPAEVLSNQGGVPAGFIHEDFGVFKAEPVLWIGYSLNSTERLEPGDLLAQTWTHRFDPYMFACTHHEANYTVAFNYSGPFFTADSTWEFLEPIVNTSVTRNPDGTWNEPGPSRNFVSPSTDVARYKKTAAYHAMGERLRYFLQGSVELEPPLPGPSYAKVYSEITSTRLVSNSSSIPLPGLQERIQNIYADLIISLLSAPQLLVVSEEPAEVRRSRFKSTFIYNPYKLWSCYAPVIFFTLVFLLVGLLTIAEDGTTFSVGFSRIMVTTRNTTLDEISKGACLGNDPFPVELMHTRLKFGVLNETGHEMEFMGLEGMNVKGNFGHCAFGVPSEVTKIKKGVAYAGLQKRREESATKKQKVD